MHVCACLSALVDYLFRLLRSLVAVVATFLFSSFAAAAYFGICLNNNNNITTAVSCSLLLRCCCFCCCCFIVICATNLRADNDGDNETN